MYNTKHPANKIGFTPRPNVRVIDRDDKFQTKTKIGHVRWLVLDPTDNEIGTIWQQHDVSSYELKFYTPLSSNRGCDTLDAAIDELTATPSEEECESKVFDMVKCNNLEELLAFCNRHGIDQMSWQTVYAGVKIVISGGLLPPPLPQIFSVIESAIESKSPQTNESKFDRMGLEVVEIEEESRAVVYRGDRVLGITNYKADGFWHYLDRSYSSLCAAALAMCDPIELARI